MLQALIVVACVLVAIAIVAMVVLVAVMDLAGHLDLKVRLALYGLAAGLLWAAPGRMATPPGAGDLLFLTALWCVLAGIYGQAIAKRLDQLDGKPDGHVDLGQVVQVLDPRRRRSGMRH